MNNFSGKTVAEYHFSLNGDPPGARIPNKELVGEEYYEDTQSGVTIVTAGSRENTAISCSLCFVAIEKIEGDRRRLASALLNQLLIIYLIRKHSDVIARS